MHSVIFLLHTLVSTYKETSVRSFWFSTDCRSLYLPYHCSFSHFFDLDKNVTKVKEEVRKRRQEVLLEQSPWSQSKMLVWSSWLKWVTLVTNNMYYPKHLDITCCTSSEHLWWEIVECYRSQWPLNDSKWGLKNSSFVQNLHPYRVEIVEWKFTERMRGFFV